MPQPGSDAHISDEDLERYSMSALAEAQLAAAEEHLLVCEGCRERLTGTDRYVAAMRAAAAGTRRERTLFRALPRPVWAAAGCLATAAVAVVMLRPPETAPPPAAVRLEAVRGVMAAHAAAPANRPLELAMDLTDLPVHPGYRVEVVDERGRRVWEGSAVPRDGRLEAGVPARFQPGRYYVRLYSPAAELLREYGLETR